MVFDLIIIGAGPAGMTAAIYAARTKLNILVLTEEFGGQMSEKTVAIENYPGFERISGQELIEKFKSHLQVLNVETKKAIVLRVEKKKDNFLVFLKDNTKLEARSLIIATGAKHRKLEAIGGDKFIGKGLSYCVTCDGPLFSDKIVAVIGGGNAGFEAALALSDFAKKIYIIEYGKNVAADEVNQGKVDSVEKIEIITNAALKEIRGGNFVQGLTYEDRTSKQEKNLALEGIFVEIGSVPSSDFLKDLVDLNNKGEIVVDAKTAKSNIPGLFCAGDVGDVPYKQIIIACGEGAKAAISAYQYLKQKNGKY